MTTITSMEHVFSRVQLVRGKGQRRKGRLCIMSFVALLAGERHTDAPATASSFIRQLAVALNDAMPEGQRQQLKLFAPRIVGTNDGLDPERARLVHTVFADEIIPQLRADNASDWLPRHFGGLCSEYFTEASRLPQNFLSTLTWDPPCPPRQAINNVAAVAAKLLITCATSAPATCDADWYWLKGIDLVDRLCDVGDASPRPIVKPDQIARAEYLLDHSSPFDAIRFFIVDAAIRMRRLQRTTGKPTGGGSLELSDPVGQRPVCVDERGPELACHTVDPHPRRPQ